MDSQLAHDGTLAQLHKRRQLAAVFCCIALNFSASVLAYDYLQAVNPLSQEITVHLR